jgi:vitamin B12 transporter
MTTKTLSLITATLLFSSYTLANERLQDITVVSATKSSQKLNDVTSNIDVITSKDIEERGYTTILQALNSLSGTSFTQNGGLGTTSSLYLRGMDSKRTLVLIDGVRYNDLTGLQGAPFAHLMVDDVAQIEVLKGAQSGIWGADASAGVINIITKKSDTGVHGSFHLEKGSFDTDRYGFSVSKKTDIYYVKMAHNVINTDGFSAQQPENVDLDTLEDDGYKNKTSSLAFGYSFNETNKIDFSHIIIDAKGEYDPFGNPNGKATSTSKSQFSSINFNHIDSFNELNIYTKRSRFNRAFTEPDFSGAIKTTPYKGDVKEHGINSKIPYAKSDFLVVGTEYKEFKQGDSINKEFKNRAFYISNTNTLSNPFGGKLLFTQSVRYDNYSTFDNKTTFKIGLKNECTLVEGLSLSANYGTAYNIPSLYQLYSPYGNDTLNPENTTSFDATIAYKDLKVTYFNTKIKDMIDFDNSTFKYANIEGTSKISGLEASYQKDIFTDFLLTLNYTHLFKAENQKGERLKRRVKDSLKVSLDYYGITKLHLGINAEYVGSRTDVKFNQDFSTTNVETGEYTLFNINANYKINKDIELYAKIVNLTDVEYQTVYGYATSPRAFYTGVRANF